MVIKKFVLSLDKKEQRPIANLYNWYNFDALIDTGAIFPVWTKGEDILKDLNAELIVKNVPFGGFGGQAFGNLYRIHDVQVGELLFPDFVVVASENLGTVPFHLILSATVFSGLRYTIDDRDHKLTVEIPDGESAARRLRIQDSNGVLHVLYQSDDERNVNKDEEEKPEDVPRRIFD